MIYRLEREERASVIIARLPQLWDDINNLVTLLRNSSVEYTTIDLFNFMNSYQGLYTMMDNFNNSHGTWFISRYPEFATALSGALTSLQSIYTIINDGLQAYYWDTETNSPIITDIIQAHRDVLATSIEGELE